MAAIAVLALLGSAAARAGDPAVECQPIFKAMDREVTSDGYRIHTSNLDPDTNQLKSSDLTEALPPNKLRIVRPDSDLVVVRNVGTFEKRKDGGWKKIKMDAPGMLLSFFAPNQGAHFKKQFKDCKKLRSEPLDGKAMDVWHYATSGFAVSSSTEIWIGVADGLPHQMKSDGKALGMRTRTVQRTEYDANIHIEPPRTFTVDEPAYPTP